MAKSDEDTSELEYVISSRDSPSRSSFVTTLYTSSPFVNCTAIVLSRAPDIPSTTKSPYPDSKVII